MIHRRKPYIGHQLIIPADAFQRLMLYVMLCPQEVAGYGLIRREENLFRLDEVFILKQVVSEQHAATNVLDLNRKVGELARQNRHDLMRFQWHSHANFPAYFSATDVNNIHEWNGDWLISFVMNKDCDIEIRLDEVVNGRRYSWHVMLLLPTQQRLSWQQNEAIIREVVSDIDTCVRTGFRWFGIGGNLLSAFRRLW